MIMLLESGLAEAQCEGEQASEAVPEGGGRSA